MMNRFSQKAAASIGRLAALHVRLLTPGIAIAGFLVIFILSTIAFQLKSDIPPWHDGSPSDIMNGVLIWMVCVICFIMASATRHDPVRSLMWIAGSAALGLVALDELFSVHEYASKIRDDDDPKIVMALGTAFAIYVLIRVERVSGRPFWLLLTGFAFHLAYLLSDLGDGDFFQISYVEHQSLQGIEEALEYTAMLFYFSAFVLIALAEFAARKPAQQAAKPLHAPASRLSRWGEVS
jgi:hypothetical protein